MCICVYIYIHIYIYKYVDGDGIIMYIMINGDIAVIRTYL